MAIIKSLPSLEFPSLYSPSHQPPLDTSEGCNGSTHVSLQPLTDPRSHGAQIFNESEFSKPQLDIIGTDQGADEVPRIDIRQWTLDCLEESVSVTIAQAPVGARLAESKHHVVVIVIILLEEVTIGFPVSIALSPKIVDAFTFQGLAERGETVDTRPEILSTQSVKERSFEDIQKVDCNDTAICIIQENNTKKRKL